MSRQKSYIPTLDGWRAVSVAAVVIYHGRFGLLENHPILMKLASRGYLGVNAFFAISGFLISGLLLREFGVTGDIDLRRFYTRRLFRIVPAYYFALATICLLGILDVIRQNAIDVPSCVLFFRNFMPLSLDAKGDFYTAHFWTLAVEEQFYLLWPVLLLALKPKQAGKVACFLSLVAYSWKVLVGHFPSMVDIIPSSAYLLMQADSLLWGCLAALYFPEIRQFAERIHYSQVWLLILMALLVGQASQVPELTALSSILLPALVLSTVLQPGSVLGRVLESRPLRWVGTLSYGIYLWQMLFLPQSAAEVAHGPLHYLQQAPWNLLAIMLCACVSRYCVEIPMTRLGHRIAATPVRSLGSVPSAAALHQ